MRVRHTCMLVLCLPLLGMVTAAQAFIVPIDGTGLFGGASIYLRVGDGVYSGNFISGGTPGDGGPVNRVSVTVPAAALGNGSNLTMTSNASQPLSFYDSYAFCNVPAQIYVGGFNRGGIFTGGDGVLTVTAPTSLVNANGNTIPFSQISWTSSGNGDGTATQPFPSGTFAGGTQILGNFPKNTWRESCHTFSYGNDAIVPAGTYNGRVTYTLAVP